MLSSERGAYMGSEKAKLRRYEDDLNVSGTGALIMGVWMLVKTLIQAMMTPIFSLAFEGEDPALVPYIRAAAVFVVSSLLLVVVVMHLYIGINAIRDARGREYKKGYRKLSAFLMVLTLLGFASYKNFLSRQETFLMSIASMIVDVTSIYIFAIILRSSGKIKQLRAEQKREDS